MEIRWIIGFVDSQLKMKSPQKTQLSWRLHLRNFWYLHLLITPSQRVMIRPEFLEVDRSDGWIIADLKVLSRIFWNILEEVAVRWGRAKPSN